MASGQEPIRVGSQPPFAVPPERRSPARRLRGRLVAPVAALAAVAATSLLSLGLRVTFLLRRPPAREVGDWN
jgi:hypothetical protein